MDSGSSEMLFFGEYWRERNTPVTQMFRQMSRTTSKRLPPFCLRVLMHFGVEEDGPARGTDVSYTKARVVAFISS